MQEDQINIMNVSVKEIEEKIELAELLDQLHRSPAFKRIILKGYFKEKSINLVKMISLPQNEMQKELVKNGMIGISALQTHFSSIYREAEQASMDLAEYNAELAEAIANGE